MFLGAVLAVAFAGVHRVIPETHTAFPPSGSIGQLVIATVVQAVDHMLHIWQHEKLFIIFLLFGPGLVLLGIVLFLANASVLRYNEYRRANSVVTATPNGHFKALPYLLAICAGFGLLGWVGERLLFPPLPTGWASRLGLSPKAVGLDDRGRLTRLDLSEEKAPPGLLEAIPNLGSLKELSLPRDVQGVVDLGRLPGLQKLKAPLSAVTNLEACAVPAVTLMDPGDRLASFVPPRVEFLGIEGRCSSLTAVRTGAPGLIRFKADEPVFRAVGANWMTDRPDLMLSVTGSEALSLDWLAPGHVRYILDLQAPIGPATRNLHLLRRAFITTRQLEAEALRPAEALEWLVLTYPAPPEVRLFKDLAVLLREGGLPRLRSLDLVRDGKGGSSALPSVAGSRSALGRERILNLLDNLARNPPKK